jgi:type I restriction enzyme S subunit
MKVVRIGDVCNLMTGGTPSRAHPEYFENGTIKWLVSGDINKGEIFECEGRITEEAMKSSNTRFLPINSVMIALNGQGKTRGTVALLRTEATCNQSLVSIYPKNIKELLPEFLYHNLKMRYQELRRMTGDDGNDRRGLNMILIRSIEIPLPSLEMQREIVAKLDRAFTEISSLMEETESRRILSSEIFKREVQLIFYKNVNGWPTSTIGNSCAYKNGKAHEQLVDPKGEFRLVTSRFVSSEGKLARRVSKVLTPLERGDVAFVLSDLPNGRALAKAYLVGAETDLALNQRVLRIRSEKFDPSFLYLQVNRHPYLLGFDNGESQTHLKLAQVLDCPLLIPDLKIQQSVALRMMKLKKEIQESDELSQQKMDKISALQQAIIHGAFISLHTSIRVA